MSRALSEGEVELADAMIGRVQRLAEVAAARGVRLMVDAEHTYFQPVGPGKGESGWLGGGSKQGWAGGRAAAAPLWLSTPRMRAG